MPSVSGRIIDRIVASGVAEWFVRAGFKRSGRSFVRSKGALFETGFIDASRFNSPEKSSFAIRLGVEWPTWLAVWTNSKPVGNPAIAPAFISSSLHPVLGGGHSHSWQTTDPDAVAAQVVAALDEFAESFWSRYSDLNSVLQEMDQGNRVPTGTPQLLVHAALLVQANRRTEAQAVLDAAKKRVPSPAIIESVASGLGLHHVA